MCTIIQLDICIFDTHIILSSQKQNAGNVNLLENNSNLIYTISHLWIKKTQPLE